MGRPRTPNQAVITTRVHPMIHGAIDRYAEGEGITFAAATRQLLVRGLLHVSENPDLTYDFGPDLDQTDEGL